MYEAVSYFRGFDDRYGYEDWESHLEAFFRYFELTSEEKCYYAQRNLDGEVLSWCVGIRDRSCRYWCPLQARLRTRYVPHLHLVPDYLLNSRMSPSFEPKEKQEPEPDNRSIHDLFTKILDGLQNLQASQDSKIDIDPEHVSIDEPHDRESAILIESKPKPKTEIEEVVHELEVEPKAEPEPNVFVESPSLVDEALSQATEVEEPLIDTFEDLPAELTMELLPSLPVMQVPFSIRLSDIYDPLQFFLERIASIKHELDTPCDLDSILTFSEKGSTCSSACAFLELPFIVVDPSRRPVPPPPTWPRQDARVLALRPPPWPD